MAGAAVVQGPKYWAFISYSHKDAAFGRRLHRRLETYAVPRRLVGRTTPQGAVPSRLVPIFRDREELPAAHDLTAEVQAALQASRSLIVVCSPDAAASRWVSREVELYRALHPERPILAAIRNGEPHECFPAALIRSVADGTPVEPLAADFRRGHDGEHLGLLKLVAGVAGLGLDELTQRDAQRNRQRVTAITAASIAAVLGMGALTAFALKARADAEHQRAEAVHQRSEAERLIGFMSTDLREKLRGVGRLDVMSVVNKAALAYYDREFTHLPTDSLAHRALLLEALGEDDENRGNNAAALSKFKQGFDITAKLLAQDPGNPERVYDHAQSMYWMGAEAYARGDLVRTRFYIDGYKKLADRLITLAPDQGRSYRELAYAESNLCSLAEQRPRNVKAALDWCGRALSHLEAAAKRMGNSDLMQADLADENAWLADAYYDAGDRADALRYRLVNERLLESLIKSDPMNMDFRTEWIAAEKALALLEKRSGLIDKAVARLERADEVSNKLVEFDPANSTWRQRKNDVESMLSSLRTKH